MILQLLRSRSASRPFVAASALAVAGLVAAACQPPQAPPPRTPPKPSASASASAPPQPAPPPKPDHRPQLAALVKKMGRKEPVLDDATMKSLEPAVQRATAKQKQQLLTDPRAAAQSPLIHVAVGGRLPGALFALATSRTIDELVQVRQLEAMAPGGKRVRRPKPPKLDDLAKVGNAIATSAARNWLLAVGKELKDPRKATPGLCEAIELVAATLDEPALAAAARLVLVEQEPSPVAWLSLVHTAAWALDLPLAEAAAKGLEASQKKGKAPNPSYAKNADQWVGRLKTALADKDEDPSSMSDAEALAAARNFLALRRWELARKVTDAKRNSAEKHLGLAGAYALAHLDGSVCPEAPPAVRLPQACAAAWFGSDQVKASTEVLEAAWKNGEGRDDTAVETYLGIVHVAPLNYGRMRPVTSAREQRAMMQDFGKRMKELRVLTGKLEKKHDTLAGFGTFLDTLVAGWQATVRRARGRKQGIVDAQRAQLEKAATTNVKAHPEAAFAQGSVLAVAAMTLVEQDIEKLLGALPRKLTTRNTRVRSVLQLWTAVSRDKEALAKEAAGDLVAVLPDQNESPITRAKYVLLLAEADFAMNRDQRTAAVLARVAERLASADMPSELRLRAVLDRAGGLVYGGKRKAAIEALAKVVADQPVRPGPGLPYQVTAASFLFALRAAESSGDERKDYIKKFENVLGPKLRRFARVLPSGVAAFREAWKQELGYLVRAEGCQGNDSCVKRLQPLRKRGHARALRLVHGEQKRMVEKGVLSVGAVQVAINYAADRGLEPLVEVDAVLPAALYPPLPAPPVDGATSTAPPAKAPPTATPPPAP